MKNEWGVDRFDLEEAMMNVAITQDDILLVAEMAYEKNWSADKTMNAWIGLAHLLEARTLKQEEIFTKLHELNEYAPDNAKALRPDHWFDKIDDDMLWEINPEDNELTYSEYVASKSGN
jgi:hypothetical protein